MSSVLSKIRSIRMQKQKIIWEEKIKNHPVIKENIETKMHYLNGLALMMNVDDKISEPKKAVLASILDVFEMPEFVINDFIAFAKESENEPIVNLLEELTKSEMAKITFMIDNFIMANLSGKETNNETELIDFFFEMLLFNKIEINSITNKIREILISIDYSHLLGDDYLLGVVDCSKITPLPKNMIKVEGGTFDMGGNEEDNEKPIHSVTLDSFLISKYQVTQKEWKEVMGNNPSFIKGENLPAEQVSWYNAVEF